jgi:hypothetical protein
MAASDTEGIVSLRAEFDKIWFTLPRLTRSVPLSRDVDHPFLGLENNLRGLSVTSQLSPGGGLTEMAVPGPRSREFQGGELAPSGSMPGFIEKLRLSGVAAGQAGSSEDRCALLATA